MKNINERDEGIEAKFVWVVVVLWEEEEERNEEIMCKELGGSERYDGGRF